ncbi:hypothetical protein HAX54_005588, partial [Datura stramonium]|nr:hypothetical protein [Datura stramonium]
MADESKVCDVGSIDNSFDNSLDSKTQDTINKKEMQPRSKVWDHFDKVVENGIGKAKCRYCKKSYPGNLSKMEQQDKTFDK